jgi:flagellin
LGGVTTKDIGIESLDVLTKASAAVAADTLDSAIDKVTAVRAEVGALQSRFNFAAANVESSISNQDSARGVLLDTDIAAESTAFSTAQVQLQAGISVLAQANQLQQNLLKLIG